MPNSLTPRQEFMATDAFALYSDVNERMLADLPTTLEIIPEYPTLYDFSLGSGSKTVGDIISANPAGSSLYMVMHQARHALPTKDQDFYNKYEVSQADKDLANGKTVGHGFADLDFAWHFAAGLANHVTEFFVDEGVITREQKNGFNLHDWANIIGSGWFSKLVHQMTSTSNGTYAQFGNVISHYKRKELTERLVSRDLIDAGVPIFELQEQVEPFEGKVYATAVLSKPAVRGLRKAMTNADSIGCPVARYSALFPANAISKNPHLSNLIANGSVSVDGERSNGKIRVSQEMTAIDNNLAFFALQLDKYAEAYGTPVLKMVGNQLFVGHEDLPFVDVCRRDIDVDSQQAEKLLGDIAIAS